MDESRVRLTSGQLGQLILSIIVITLILAVALFWPAGTLDYPQAQCYFIGFMLWMIFGSIWFVFAYPALIVRRLNVGPRAETRLAQKIIQVLLLVVIGGMLAIPGFDRRYGWGPRVPWLLSVFSGIGILAGFGLGAWSAAYNEFMATTITVEKTHKVISTGPYGIVRHPMYSGVMMWTTFSPLALGSWYGLLPSLGMVLVIVWRMFDEEAHLKLALNGYAEYCGQVRWRLLPYIF
jgi:protein-S-isoprenylcysteine O-methyltransferase Ste14